MANLSVPLLSALALLVTSGTARALEPTPVPVTDAPPDKASTGDPATGGGGVQVADSSVGGKTDTGAKADNTRNDHQSTDEPWIRRYRPTAHQLEGGIYGGVLLPNGQHELYNPYRAWEPYKKVAADIGLRLGYYPLSFLGLEIEGGVMPTKVRDGSSKAVLGNFRGYGVLQLPYRITPFVLAGFGMLATTGSSQGSDVDSAFHFGGGVKFYINRLLALRVDVRDNVTAKHLIDNGRTHHVEVLLGLSLLLNRRKPVPKLDVDSDGDGFLDRLDRCVSVPGVAPDGCPPPPPVDTDGDGFIDAEDNCVDVPGTAPDTSKRDQSMEAVTRFVRAFTYENIPWRKAQAAGQAGRFGDVGDVARAGHRRAVEDGDGRQRPGQPWHPEQRQPEQPWHPGQRQPEQLWHPGQPWHLEPTWHPEQLEQQQQPGRQQPERRQQEQKLEQQELRLEVSFALLLHPWQHNQVWYWSMPEQRLEP